MNPDLEIKYPSIIDDLGQGPTLSAVVSQLLKVINHLNSGAENEATLVEKLANHVSHLFGSFIIQGEQ